MGRIEKLLDNSIVKVRFLKKDLEKIKEEIKNLRGGSNKNGNQKA